MKKRLVISLLAMLLVLAACNGGAVTESPSVATVAATATSEPTATAAVTATAEMTASDDITTTIALTTSDDITGAGAITGSVALTNTEDISTTGMVAAPRELILASDLQGYTVLNTAGENLGSVQDLVFNVDDGQILLVTVEYGGFLDIGDKVFPIPLSAFRFEQTRDEIPAVATAVPGGVVTDTTQVTGTTGAVANESMAIATDLVLDIPEETFANAPGFADNFPVLTEPASVGEIERFYRKLGEDVIGRPIAETDLEALTGRVVKLSDITGSSVQNPDGEGVGEINDLLIDLRAGKIEYLILSFGGFLGIGENQYAIPVDAFEVIPSSADVEAGAPVLVLDITEEQLTGVPAFDSSNLGNPDWDIDSRDFWLNR